MTATEPIDPVIAELMEAALPLLAPGGGPIPTPAPAENQERVVWESDVALMRARHDSSALEAGILYEKALEDALGADPLGIGQGVIRRDWAEVSVDGGTVGLRIYSPEASAPLPAIALIHGGAYWMGGGSAGWQLNDALCRKLAAGVSAVVVNIDHRLAPEHPYPTPLNDVSSAIDWISQHANELGADPARLAVFGISSGGNLAAAAAHRSADGEGAPVAAVVLQCPSVNLSLDSSRFSAPPEDVAGARQIIALYAQDADVNDPAVSPGLRPDLTGLAPTLIVTAEHDALTPDAHEYVGRLIAAGVDAEEHRYNMTHTVASPTVFRTMHDETVAWLRERL